MAPTRSGTRRTLLRPAVIGLLLVVAIVGALGLWAASRAEVVEKGKLLPYTEGKIYKVRFPGGLTLYVEPDLKPSFDLLNAYLLTGLAFISLTFAVLLGRLGADSGRAPLRFFALAFVGASYLVADELLGIHETLGHNLRFLARLPLVERPDDAVLLLLGIPAALALFLFRSVILSSPAAVALFGAGAVLFLVAGVADLLSLPLEEVLEVLATLCLVAAMLVLGLHHTRAQPSSARGTT